MDPDFKNPDPSGSETLVKFHSSFTLACFADRKVRLLCFALPALHLKGQINLFYMPKNSLFLFLKHRSELEHELQPELPLFSRLRLQPKRAAPQHSTPPSLEKKLFICKYLLFILPDLSLLERTKRIALRICSFSS